MQHDSSNKPRLLVTNDDGIDSVFLQRFVAALRRDFRITVAAPAKERSWIGRAVTRHGEVKAHKRADLFFEDVTTWCIEGTPTDCVNIALGNLLSEPPDGVVSGINLGFNTAEPLILSSGTVAGAIEGALWRLPALAFSQCIPPELYESLQQTRGKAEGDFAASLQASAEHARSITGSTLKQPPAPGTVVNVNFPVRTTADTPIETTFPARIALGGLYEETGPGAYRFRYSRGTPLDSDPRSDRATLERGSISRTYLNLAGIGRGSVAPGS